MTNFKSISNIQISNDQKVIGFDKLNEFSEHLKKLRKIVVLVGGCFDILHIGHVRFLKKAKEQGDMLVVALESDEKTRRLKGEGRPINTQDARAEVLASLEMVDYVLKLAPNLADADYLEFTRKLSPTVLAVSEDNSKIEAVAEKTGAKYIKVMSLIRDMSTSKLAKLLGIK